MCGRRSVGGLAYVSIPKGRRRSWRARRCLPSHCPSVVTLQWHILSHPLYPSLHTLHPKRLHPSFPPSLPQIFLDMAVLVEAQGELLDNIEAQVARSVGYVQAGTNHLQAAKQHQRSKRKWMCCGLITGIIVILIVVLVVIGTTRGFGSS